MTVSTTTAEIIYQGNGSTTAFAVPFVFFGQGELLVSLRNATTAAETPQVLTTNYTVAGGNGGTGTVTMTAAPSASNLVVIRRATARTQLVDYQTGDAFPAETHERALDRLAAAVQEIDERVARGAGVPRLIGNSGSAFVIGAENKLILTSGSLDPYIQLPDPATCAGRELTFLNAMTFSARVAYTSLSTYFTRLGGETAVLFAANTAGSWKVLTSTGSVWREMIGS